MKKRGIVLMMTLLLITVLMGVVTLVLHKSSHISESVSSGFSQSASLRIINDLENELPSLLASVNTAEELDIAMRIPIQIESDKRDFALDASFASVYQKININKLMNSDGSVNEPFMKAWMRLFELYPIGDRDVLINLILDSIDTDLIERSDQSEIGWTRADFKNGSIADMNQFDQIIERYIQLTRDKTVLRIPWEKYVGFQGEKIDINAVNPETLSLILPNLSAAKVHQMTLYRTKAFISKEEAVGAEPSLSELFDTYFFVYESGLSYNLLCHIRLRENAHTEQIGFQYNLLDKTVRNVEIL